MTEIEEQKQFELDLQMSLTFDERLPATPLATDAFELGAYKMPRSKALKKAYLQFNHENLTWRLVFDVDCNIAHLEAEGFRSIGLPEPSWWLVNTTGNYGRAHVCYELAAPIPRTELAHRKPIQYAAAVQAGIITQMLKEGVQVDLGFAELLCKNPRYLQGRRLLGSGLEYTLEELADWVPLDKRKPKNPRGLGRNCALFDGLRLFAYAQKRHCSTHALLLQCCTAKASEINQSFETPLPMAEVKATVKSVSKWVWQHFDVAASDRKHQERIKRTHTPEIQALRGLKSGAVRFQGSITATEPWKAEGVSRATWYRRQKSGA